MFVRVLLNERPRSLTIARIEDKSKPIIEIGQRSSIEGFTIKYDDGYVTGNETEFERIALDAIGSHSWQNGASAKNIAIENAGTGILSRDSANTPDGKSASTFSVTFENIVFKDFSWKGLSFLNAYRTGNLYRSLTFLSSKYTPQSAMYLKGDESECNMIDITVQDLQARQPIYFERIEAAVIENLNFNHVSAATGSILNWSSCSGEIENLTFDNCETENTPLINIGSTMMGNWDLLKSLKINNFTIKNMDSSAANYIIGRQENHSTEFFLNVENYSATGKWSDFPNLATEENGIIITKKGEIRTEGTTAQRPTKCLCPYYSKYFDTDLQKLLVWTGNEWK